MKTEEKTQIKGKLLTLASWTCHDYWKDVQIENPSKQHLQPANDGGNWELKPIAITHH